MDIHWYLNIPVPQAVCGTTFGEAAALFSDEERKDLEIKAAACNGDFNGWDFHGDFPDFNWILVDFNGYEWGFLICYEYFSWNWEPANHHSEYHHPFKMFKTPVDGYTEL